MALGSDSGLLDEPTASSDPRTSGFRSKSKVSSTDSELTNSFVPRQSSNPGTKPTKFSPVHTSARRGPVIVSSEEESESEPIRPQVLRALSRTPSWAKSSVSPSPSPRQGTTRPTEALEKISSADLESDPGPIGPRRRRRSSSTGSRSSTNCQELLGGVEFMDVESVSSQENPRWGSVFGSDSMHESDSGESGRIRDRVESERSWSQSQSRSQSPLLSPSRSSLSSRLGNDSTKEFVFKNDSPRSSSGHGSAPLIPGGARNSKARRSDGLGAESGSFGFTTLGSPLEIPGSLSGEDGGRQEELDSGSDLEEKFGSNISRKLRHSSSKSSSVALGEVPGTEKRLESQPSDHYDAEYASLEQAAHLNSSQNIPDSPSSSKYEELDSKGRRSPASNADLHPTQISSKHPNTSLSTAEVKKPRGKRSHKAKTRKFNLDYVELLNEDIRQAASRGVHGCDRPLGSAESRMIMGSVWNWKEQTAFFQHLSIVGKDNLPDLARGVGTKSIVECRAYLKALQDGREEDVFFPNFTRDGSGREMISAKDVPAAIELSDECVQALEEHADILERRALTNEVQKERGLWGDSWLLDSATAEHIEQLYKKKRIKEIHDIAPEAELLDLGQMLGLSEYIFMHGTGENNWEHWGEDLPSIRRTALSDIHTLVVSLTRRIVQTSLFMAMSRLRSMDGKVFHPQSLVRPSDVDAAIDCLGVPRKLGYWVNLPRRLGLKVYRKVEQIRLRSDKNAIPYDELENILRQGEQKSGTPGSPFGSDPGQEASGSGGNGDLEVDMDALIASAYEDNGEEESGDDELSDFNKIMDIDEVSSSDTEKNQENDLFVDEAGQISRSKIQKKLDARIAAQEAEEDSFMELLDRKHSLKAEKTLWQMMGEKPNKKLPKDTIELPKKPARVRKRASEILDWRDGVAYLAPWEVIKRRKTGGEDEGEVEGEEWGEMEEETMQEEILQADEGTQSRFIAKRTPVSAASVSALAKVISIQKTRPIPQKKPAKKRQTKSKKLPVPVISSPRKIRVRRQSKSFAGYVSTIENIVESDAEALAREQEDDGSVSEEEVHGVDSSPSEGDNRDE